MEQTQWPTPTGEPVQQVAMTHGDVGRLWSELGLPSLVSRHWNIFHQQFLPAILAARSLPVQGEAVGRVIPCSIADDGKALEWFDGSPEIGAMLFATHPSAQPASPERKPLTDEQIRILHEEVMADPHFGKLYRFARAIEAAHGIAATQEPRT